MRVSSRRPGPPCLATWFPALILFSLAAAAPVPARADAPFSSGARRLFVSVGGTSLRESFLNNTYGTVPHVGIMLTSQIGPAPAELVVGAGLETESGRYADYSWGIGELSSVPARITLIPLEAGLRANASKSSGRRFYIGALLRYVYLRESISGSDPQPGDDSPPHTGWGWGARVALGPEWEFGAAERYATGLEFTAGFNDGDVTHAAHRYSLGSTFVGIRAYVGGRF